MTHSDELRPRAQVRPRADSEAGIRGEGGGGDGQGKGKKGEEGGRINSGKGNEEEARGKTNHNQKGNNIEGKGEGDIERFIGRKNTRNTATKTTSQYRHLTNLPSKRRKKRTSARRDLHHGTPRRFGNNCAHELSSSPCPPPLPPHPTEASEQHTRPTDKTHTCPITAGVDTQSEGAPCEIYAHIIRPTSVS